MKDPGTEKFFENKCQHIFSLPKFQHIFSIAKFRLELISDYPDPQFSNHTQFKMKIASKLKPGIYIPLCLRVLMIQ